MSNQSPHGPQGEEPMTPEAAARIQAATAKANGGQVPKDSFAARAQAAAAHNAAKGGNAKK